MAKAYYLIGVFISGVWKLWEYITVFLIGLLSILGVLVLLDFSQTPNLPAIHALTPQAKLEAECIGLGLPLRFAPNVCVFVNGDAFKVDGRHYPQSAEQCWHDLRIALAYLDKACPAVSAWVRNRHDTNHIVWEFNDDRKYRAAYQPSFELLYIPRNFFRHPHERRAEALAHEFRHSQQSLLRFTQHVLADACGFASDRYVEDEAYDFGERVYLAINHGYTRGD